MISLNVLEKLCLNWMCDICQHLELASALHLILVVTKKTFVQGIQQLCNVFIIPSTSNLLEKTSEHIKVGLELVWWVLRSFRV